MAGASAAAAGSGSDRIAGAAAAVAPNIAVNLTNCRREMAPRRWYVSQGKRIRSSGNSESPFRFVGQQDEVNYGAITTHELPLRRRVVLPFAEVRPVIGDEAAGV